MYNFQSPRSKRRFRVMTTIRQRLAARKRQIQRRLNRGVLGDCSKPVFTASNIQFEIADRARGLAFGGIVVSTRTKSIACKISLTTSVSAFGSSSPPPSSSGPFSTWTAPWSKPPAIAKRAWTSPTTAPGATIPWWSPWPTPARSCAWSTGLQKGQDDAQRQADPIKTPSQRRQLWCASVPWTAKAGKTAPRSLV